MRTIVIVAMRVCCNTLLHLQAAVAAMKRLLKGGAVPDTWAPNGSSALMLAASADATAALQVRKCFVRVFLLLGV
jgi:hypothetical protein